MDWLNSAGHLCRMSSCCRVTHCLLLLLGLLAGCQSERLAFQLPSSGSIVRGKHPLASASKSAAQLQPLALATAALDTAAATQKNPMAAATAPVGQGLCQKNRAAARRIYELPFRFVGLRARPQLLQQRQFASMKRHPAQASRPATSNFEPSTLYILAGIALLVFLIAKFPLVMLIILGALLIGGIILLLSLFSGHYAYG